MIYGLADVVFRFVNFCTFPIFAHLLSVEEFGTIGLTLTISGLLSVFYGGVHNTIQRYYFEEGISHERRKVLVSTSLLFLLISSLTLSLAFISILYPLRIALYDKFLLEWHYIVFSILTIIPTQISILASCVLRLNFSPWKFSLHTLCFNTFNVACGLFLVAGLNLGITGFILGAFIASILVLPIGLWFIKNELTWRFDVHFVREIMSFGSPFIITGVAFWVFNSMDRWMLGELSTLHELGLYSIALKISLILMMLKTAFGQSWNPHAYKLYESAEDYASTYSRVFTSWYFVLILCGTCLMLFSPEFFAYTTPREFSDANAIVIFSVAGIILFGTTEFSTIGISLKKETKYLAYGAWWGAITNVILNYMLIPSQGALGAAFATFISYGVLMIYYLYHSQRLHPIPLENRKLATNTALLGSSIILSFYFLKFPLSIELFLVKSSFVIFLLILGVIQCIGSFSRYPGSFKSFSTKM